MIGKDSNKLLTWSECHIEEKGNVGHIASIMLNLLFHTALFRSYIPFNHSIITYSDF